MNNPPLTTMNSMTTMTSRPDIYAKVHRGLRASLFNLSTLVGRTDFLDDNEVGAMRAAARDVLYFLHEHGVNEERWVLSILEAKVPSAADHDHESHVRIEAEVAALEQSLDDVAKMKASDERRLAGERLYHQYNRFLSGYLLHMEEEEVATTAMLHAYCSDDELRGITASIMQNSAPEDLEMALRAFMPHIDSKLRIAFVSEVAATAPPHVLRWMLDSARETLVEKEYTILCEALAIEA